MKVYVKKEDRDPILPAIIVTIIFLAIPIGMFIGAILSKKSFIGILEMFGISLIFGMLFLLLGIFFIHMMIKKPRIYNSVLINKKNEVYKDKQITYMEFKTCEDLEYDKDSISYYCYTFGPNELVIGKTYALGIKQSNWKPKYVKELTDCGVKEYQPNVKIIFNLSFVLNFIFGGLLFFCILGLITHPEYSPVYISLGIFSIIALCYIYKINKK